MYIIKKIGHLVHGNDAPELVSRYLSILDLPRR